MDEIIKEFGFSDGFSIPVADAENKILEAEVREQRKEREKLLSQLDDGKDRLKSVKNYLENVNEKQKQGVKALFEYDCQIRSGESVLNSIENQIRSLDAEEKSLTKNMLAIENWKESTANETERVVHRLNQLNTHVEFDLSALEAWTSAAEKIGEDYSLLEHFAEQDRTKFNHLELKRQHLRQEVGIKRKKFEMINDDVLSLEQSLEKIGNLFMSQHNDRQALVDQWHGAVRVLHQRDEDIYRTIDDIASLRAQAKQRIRELEEQKTFIANEERNNKEMETELNRLNHDSTSTACTVRDLETSVAELNGQFLVERGALTATAGAVEANRSACRMLAERIMKKRKFCSHLEVVVDELNQQIYKDDGKANSSAQRVSYLEELKRREEYSCEKLGIELNKMSEKVRLVTEELLRLRAAEKEQRAMMSDTVLNNLKLRISAALAEQLRQQEMSYKAELTYLEKDVQYREMMGRVDPEEKEKLEKKLKETQILLKDCERNHLLLEKEVYRLDQEYRRLCTALENDEEELNSLRKKRQEFILLTEGGEKRANALKSTNQDLQVDENVVRLRVNHLEKALHHVGSQLYSLEKQRLELDEAVRERAMEIESWFEKLNIRKRALNEQLSQLNMNINAAKLKVEHIETKYSLNMQSFGTTDEGEVISVTALKIQAAQERFELQEMGDKLDSKIKKAEQEINAMENTLKVVLISNSSFKCSLSRLPTDGAELEEKAALELSYMKAVESLREKRRCFQVLQESLTKIQDSLQSQLELESQLLKEASGRANEVTESDRKLESLAEKKNRAGRDLRQSLRKLHGSVMSDVSLTIEEKDIGLRELREQNQAALQQLGEVAPNVMEAAPVVIRYLRERGLALPQASARRSSNNSRGSSIVASNSSITIDSLSLGDHAEVKEAHGRRPSILKTGKKKPGKKASSDSIDFVDLVIPQQK